MEKLIRGIIDFRKNVLPERREMFARMAAGQSPDVLFITCSDSRVAPNWFASTNPGELFVVRNVGNLVPPCDCPGSAPNAEFDHSVAAAIEFAVGNLAVTDIVVCGHSGCGAIRAISGGLDKVTSPHLRQWLAVTDRSLREKPMQFVASPGTTEEDELSQQSVLHQVEHLKTYPQITEKVKAGQLRLHPWWFNIAMGSVYFFDDEPRSYRLLDDTVAEHHIRRLKLLGRGRPAASSDLNPSA